MGTIRRIARAAANVILGGPADSYLATLRGAEQAWTRCCSERDLRKDSRHPAPRIPRPAADRQRAPRATGADRMPAARTTPPGRTVPSAAHPCPSRYPAGRSGQPHRAFHPPEAGTWRAHPRVLHRRITTKRRSPRNPISEPRTMPASASTARSSRTAAIAPGALAAHGRPAR